MTRYLNYLLAGVVALLFIFAIILIKSSLQSNDETELVNAQVMNFSEEDEEGVATKDIDIEALEEEYGANIDSVYQSMFGIQAEEEIEYDEQELTATNTISNAKEKISRATLDAIKPNYMVLAGAFKTEENAILLVDELEVLGYEEVEVVKFDFSDYTSVCVNRTNDYVDATSLVIALQEEGIESYVHKRKVK